MANRLPQGKHSDQPATEPMPVWTPPQPGSYERRGMDTQHRHDGGREEFHYQGNLPHYHDPDSGILVFFDPAAEAPTSAAIEVDPNPATPAGPGAATPDAARASEPALTGGGGDTAGSGRPIVSEHGICTDCGRSLTWDEIVGHWWHDDPEVAAMAAFGLDGHLVHRDKLPAHHPNMLAYRPARRSRDHDPITGRFLPRSDTSARVAAEHALIDMDARLYLDDVARRISGALTAVTALTFNVEALRLEDAMAVKAGMLVRLGSEDGAP